MVSSRDGLLALPKKLRRREDFDLTGVASQPVDSDTDGSSATAAAAAAAEAADVSKRPRLHLRCDEGFLESFSAPSPAKSNSISFEKLPNRLLLRVAEFLFLALVVGVSSLTNGFSPRPGGDGGGEFEASGLCGCTTRFSLLVETEVSPTDVLPRLSRLCADFVFS